MPGVRSPPNAPPGLQRRTVIEIRPLNPVTVAGRSEARIGVFADSEWWNLLELARRYGFDPPDPTAVLVQYPRPFDHPVEIDAEASRDLWRAVSAVWKDEAVPYATTWEASNETSSFGTVDLPGVAPEGAHVGRETAHQYPEFHVGRAELKRLVDCAGIGARSGGIEIRRVRDED